MDRSLLKVTTGSGPGDTVVVRMVGEIDLSTTPLVVDGLTAAGRAAPRRVLADLRGVTFLGAAGLGALLDMHLYYSAGDVELTILPSAPVRYMATIMGLEQLLRLADAVDDGAAAPPHRAAPSERRSTQRQPLV